MIMFSFARWLTNSVARVELLLRNCGRYAPAPKKIEGFSSGLLISGDIRGICDTVQLCSLLLLYDSVLHKQTRASFEVREEHLIIRGKKKVSLLLLALQIGCPSKQTVLKFKVTYINF